MSVLTKNKLLLNHPGHQVLGNDLYANEKNAQIDLMKRKAYHGRYKVSPNSLTIPGTSSFVLVPGTIITQSWLVASLVVPQHGRAPDGWIYKAIDRIEVIVSGNSSIQSLQVSGEALFLYVMATCASKEKRNALLRASPAFNLTGAGATQSAAMPLSLFFCGPEMKAAFPLDSSTLQSQIQINIRWKNAYEFLSGSTGNAITVPSAFSDLYLRCNQVEFTNGSPLAESMAADPSQYYSIPSNYIQSYQTTMTLTHGSEAALSLSTIPAGNLQAILVSLIPQSWIGTSSTVQYVNPFSIDVLDMRMLYNGQEIYRVEKPEEFRCLSVMKSDEADGFAYEYLNTVSVAAAATNGFFRGSVICIPMCNEISDVLSRRRHEHTQSFEGSTLDLYFTPRTIQEYDTSLIARTSLSTPTGSVYNVTICYIIASLVEIGNRSVSLETQ